MKITTGILAAVVVALGTAGAIYFFDVEQTQQAALPDVEVNVEGGALPKYDVEAGSVEVGTKEVKVKVPEVKMVEKTVSVPTVDVEPASD